MSKMEKVSATLLRVFLGSAFFMHGMAKFQGGIENTAGFFESIGIPSFMAYIVTFIELIGGLALLLGIGTKVFSSLFAVILVGAIVKAKLAVGFFGDGQMSGYELDLALLVLSLYLASKSKQFFALDNFVFRFSSKKQKV